MTLKLQKNDDINITKGAQEDQKERSKVENHCTTTSLKTFIVHKAKHKRTK